MKILASIAELTHKIQPIRELQQCVAKELVSIYEPSLPWDDDENDGLEILISNILRRSKNSRQKMLRIKQLHDVANTVALLSKRGDQIDDVVVFFDESLTQKLVNAGPWNTEDEKLELHKLCMLMTGAAAVVYLDAPLDTILGRLDGRRAERIIDRHRGIGRDELIDETMKCIESSKQIAKALKEIGMCVITVDGTAPLADQQELVENVLSNELPI